MGRASREKREKKILNEVIKAKWDDFYDMLAGGPFMDRLAYAWAILWARKKAPREVKVR